MPNVEARFDGLKKSDRRVYVRPRNVAVREAQKLAERINQLLHTLEED